MLNCLFSKDCVRNLTLLWTEKKRSNNERFFFFLAVKTSLVVQEDEKMNRTTNTEYLIERALSFAAMSSNCIVSIMYEEATGQTIVTITPYPVEEEA